LFQITARFPTFYVSQGSVATRLRCGGVFNHYFVTRFLLRPTAKYFENRSIDGKVTRAVCSALFDSPVQRQIQDLCRW